MHITRQHLGAKNYYDKFISKEQGGLCAYCKKPCKFISIPEGHNKFCCHTCSIKCPDSQETTKKRSFAQKKFRATLSEEAKRALGRGCHANRTPESYRLTPVHLEALKAAATGKRSKKFCQAMKRLRTGKKLSLATRAKQSKSICKAITEGRLHPEKAFKNAKTGFFLSCKNKSIIFSGSSYEEKALNVLEFLSPFNTFSRCSFKIPYILSDNSKHGYVPDFFASLPNGESTVIEVKPNSMVHDPLNQTKFAAAIAYCKEKGYKFDVWTEDFLSKVPIVSRAVESKELIKC